MSVSIFFSRANKNSRSHCWKETVAVIFHIFSATLSSTLETYYFGGINHNNGVDFLGGRKKRALKVPIFHVQIGPWAGY